MRTEKAEKKLSNRENGRSPFQIRVFQDAFVRMFNILKRYLHVLLKINLQHAV